MSVINKNVQEFTNSLKNLTISERHKEWIKHLNNLEDSVNLLPNLKY